MFLIVRAHEKGPVISENGYDALKFPQIDHRVSNPFKADIRERHRNQTDIRDYFFSLENGVKGFKQKILYVSSVDNRKEGDVSFYFMC